MSNGSTCSVPRQPKAVRMPQTGTAVVLTKILRRKDIFAIRAAFCCPKTIVPDINDQRTSSANTAVPLTPVEQYSATNSSGSRLPGLVQRGIRPDRDHLHGGAHIIVVPKPGQRICRRHDGTTTATAQQQRQQQNGSCVSSYSFHNLNSQPGFGQRFRTQFRFELTAAKLLTNLLGSNGTDLSLHWRL